MLRYWAAFATTAAVPWGVLADRIVNDGELMFTEPIVVEVVWFASVIVKLGDAPAPDVFGAIDATNWAPPPDGGALASATPIDATRVATATTDTQML
jgi:hypothetical protein